MMQKVTLAMTMLAMSALVDSADLNTACVQHGAAKCAAMLGDGTSLIQSRADVKLNKTKVTPHYQSGSYEEAHVLIDEGPYAVETGAMTEEAEEEQGTRDGDDERARNSDKVPLIKRYVIPTNVNLFKVLTVREVKDAHGEYRKLSSFGNPEGPTIVRYVDVLLKTPVKDSTGEDVDTGMAVFVDVDKVPHFTESLRDQINPENKPNPALTPTNAKTWSNGEEYVPIVESEELTPIPFIQRAGILSNSVLSVQVCCFNKNGATDTTIKRSRDESNAGTVAVNKLKEDLKALDVPWRQVDEQDFFHVGAHYTGHDDDLYAGHLHFHRIPSEPFTDSQRTQIEDLVKACKPTALS